jgi:hypothetical protein
MIMEKNREILKKALLKMPDYHPEASLWYGVESSLNIDMRAEALQQLSRFDPPEEVWNSIDRHLSENKSWKIMAPVSRLVKWSSVAAAIILCGILINTIFINNKNKLHYSEEWLIIADVRYLQESDTSSYRKIEHKCKIQPAVCQSDEFLKMKQELDFLDQSKQAILSRMSPYNPDKNLETILERIDKERTGILDQMIAFSN